MNLRCVYTLGVLLSVAAVVPLPAAMTVELIPSEPPVTGVGEIRTWNAAVSAEEDGTVWYRFRVREAGGSYRMIRDYSPSSLLEWTAVEHEGMYEVEVSVRNLATGETSSASALFEAQSRVSGGTPAINPTVHPLVFLYSAPACAEGSRMKVRFESPDGFVQETSEKPCRDGRTMNFYLGGLRPNTDYRVQHTVVSSEGVEVGPQTSLTVSGVSFEVPSRSATSPHSGTQPVIVHSPLNGQHFASDLQGNLVWYYPGWLSYLTRTAPGGYFLGVVTDNGRDPSWQMVRRFDMAGMTVLETNAARVAEQLKAMGLRPISSFHHEARELPDGRIVVLATVEQFLTDVQGPGTVNVVGEAVVVLNQEMEVVWTWDAFDHLDPARAALLGEKCNRGGCSPLFLTDNSEANDWLHANAISLTPDGDFLVSLRHQDWIIKINYDHGRGDGAVEWRLGKDGDFEFVSFDPYPWFSHQHDAGFVPGDDHALLLFDNGNARRLADSDSRSRGQLIRLDEKNMTATLELNADLGDYSSALGSAQKLENGNYHFGLGIAPGNRSRSIEVDPSGQVVYEHAVSALVYRSYRAESLYTGPR